MAIQIPSVTGPQVRNRGLAIPQVRPEVQVPSLGESLAEPAAKAGMQIWQKSQEDADTTAIIQAESQLSDWKINTMFHPESGVYNKKGASALDITNQTLPQYDAEVDRISSTLTNDRQKARFQQLAAGQRNSLNGELNRYEYGERQSYYDDVDKASLNSAQTGAVSYYNDPQQVAYYQNKSARVIASNGLRKGLPPELIEQNVRKQSSAISTAVIQRMAIDDPLKAQQYYAANADGMTVEDQAQMTKLLGTSVRKQWGSQSGEAAYNYASGGANALPMLIIQAESSGDPTAVSPKGARGLMQLMPDTAKEMAKELGIPYDEARLTADPNYNTSLGTAYLNKLLGRYNGNTTLAVAAYNAGPGNVDQWIKDNGDPRTGEVTDAAFIQKIPFGETKDYTTKIVAQMQPATATTKIAAATQWINQNIEDPETRRYALDKADDLFKADQLVDKANYESAANIVYDQGMDAVPSQLLNALTVDDRRKLDDLDAHRRKGTEPKTVDAKFEEFLKMPPAQLKALSLERDIRPYLNNSDYAKVTTAWQAAQRGSEATQQALKAEHDSVRVVMNLAGIQFGNSKDAQSTDNLQKRQAFESNYNRLRAAFVEKNKAEPTPEEAQKIAEQLLINVRLGGTGFFKPNQVPAWQVKPDQTGKVFIDPSDIDLDELSPNERQAAVDRLRTRGININEATMQEAYVEVLKARGLEVRR